MRSHSRNVVAEPIIAALVNGQPVTEREARDWVTNILRVEREGFSSRILRRLSEARYYHGPRTGRGNGNDLLSEQKVRQIIEEETH